jgi:hypothetical protein
MSPITIGISKIPQSGSINLKPYDLLIKTIHSTAKTAIIAKTSGFHKSAKRTEGLAAIASPPANARLSAGEISDSRSDPKFTKYRR